jgi:hypothetical protein
MLGRHRTKGGWTDAMKTSAKPAAGAAPAWVYVHRASDAVDMANAAVRRTDLSPAAREELALEVAAMMGKLELLLSTLQRRDGRDSIARRRTGSA